MKNTFIVVLILAFANITSAYASPPTPWQDSTKQITTSITTKGLNAQTYFGIDQIVIEEKPFLTLVPSVQYLSLNTPAARLKGVFYRLGFDIESTGTQFTFGIAPKTNQPNRFVPGTGLKGRMAAVTQWFPVWFKDGKPHLLKWGQREQWFVPTALTFERVEGNAPKTSSTSFGVITGLWYTFKDGSIIKAHAGAGTQDAKFFGLDLGGDFIERYDMTYERETEFGFYNFSGSYSSNGGLNFNARLGIDMFKYNKITAPKEFKEYKSTLTEEVLSTFEVYYYFANKLKASNSGVFIYTTLKGNIEFGVGGRPAGSAGADDLGATFFALYIPLAKATSGNWNYGFGPAGNAYSTASQFIDNFGFEAGLQVSAYYFGKINILNYAGLRLKKVKEDGAVIAEGTSIYLQTGIQIPFGEKFGGSISAGYYEDAGMYYSLGTVYSF